MWSHAHTLHRRTRGLPSSGRNHPRRIPGPGVVSTFKTNWRNGKPRIKEPPRSDCPFRLRGTHPVNSFSPMRTSPACADRMVPPGVRAVQRFGNIAEFGREVTPGITTTDRQICCLTLRIQLPADYRGRLIASPWQFQIDLENRPARGTVVLMLWIVCQYVREVNRRGNELHCQQGVFIGSATVV